MSFDADSLTTAWATFSGIVTSVWIGFNVSTGNLLQQVNKIWEVISGFATSLLNKVSGLTKRLPNALQKIVYPLIDQVKSLWKSINDEWNKVFNEIKTWIDSALKSVHQFVLRVTLFGESGNLENWCYFFKIYLQIPENILIYLPRKV